MNCLDEERAVLPRPLTRFMPPTIINDTLYLPTFPISPKRIMPCRGRFLCSVLFGVVRMRLYGRCLEARNHAIRPQAQKDPDFKIQGEYVGEGMWPGGASEGRRQVIALGDGQFTVVVTKGGLPGDGWRRDDPRFSLHGKRSKRHDRAVRRGTSRARSPTRQ